MINKEEFMEKMERIDPNKYVGFGYDENFKQIHLSTNFGEMAMRNLIQDCIEDKMIYDKMVEVLKMLVDVIDVVRNQRMQIAITNEADEKGPVH